MAKPRIIAFYLPQFHPTPNNDKWWGKGFTEWTNVCKAKPLFRGHYQPHVPADLGFYDLRLAESRLAQAEMAKEYGVEGFCYYHYWFGEGRQELEHVFNEVLKSGEPDFPFMLCWANESWHSKFWNNDGTVSKKLLVEQKYGGIDDYTKHFFHLLPAFKDKRYIRIDNKPAFMLFRPLEFEQVSDFINLWKKLAKENGLEGIFFIGQTFETEIEVDEVFNKGFGAVNTVRLFDIQRKRKLIEKALQKIERVLLTKPFVYSYAKAKEYFVEELEKNINIIPTIIPNWDHTPRSGNGGYVLTKSNPKLFGEHVRDAIDVVKDKPLEHRLIFIKSWNEWGEGNYMEPDLKFGTAYLEELRNNL
ncbi:MAG: glycoside hydrolase family 99-like domain-containing protein [Bacteroidales bacterium]|jgi:hypothetical protein|nr:glycoside hydrolase family 99-like domain-containing protein [Bacteroidales bacterium]